MDELQRPLRVTNLSFCSLCQLAKKERKKEKGEVYVYEVESPSCESHGSTTFLLIIIHDNNCFGSHVMGRYVR